jgi:plasmid stability protein
MPNLSIKDVPEAWAEALRQRAARNHRSLQGELMAIVEQALKQETEAPTSPVDPANPGASRIVGYDPRGRPIVQRGWKTIEQIAAEQRARGQPPADSGPLGVDIVREARDSR